MASLAPCPRLLYSFSAVVVVAAACNPYDYQKEEFNAGPVNAANFPKPYQGDGADTNVNGYFSGRGKFIEIRAFIHGDPLGYYSFPFTNTQLTAGDPLALPTDPQKLPRAPNAYVFDAGPSSPFPVSQTCFAPANYAYDDRTRDMRLDEQGNIFTQLPLATERPGQAATFEYIPVVAELAVSAQGLACQSIKSEKALKRILGSPPSTGKFLLWAIIDPSSGVYRVGQQSTYGSPGYASGLGVQKWGWFGQYYLAYIDGGYVPATNVNGQVRLMPQPLYVSRQITSDAIRCGGTTCTPGQVCAGTPATCQACQSSGARACPRNFQCGTGAPVNGLCNASGGSALGAGGDVLAYRRGEDGYSPVCQIFQYDVPPIDGRPRAPAELPKSENDVRTMGTNIKIPDPLPAGSPRSTDPPPRYVYCPQVD